MPKHWTGHTKQNLLCDYQKQLQLISGELMIFRCMDSKWININQKMRHYFFSYLSCSLVIDSGMVIVNSSNILLASRSVFYSLSISKLVSSCIFKSVRLFIFFNDSTYYFSFYTSSSFPLLLSLVIVDTFLYCSVSSLLVGELF